MLMLFVGRFVCLYGDGIVCLSVWWCIDLYVCMVMEYGLVTCFAILHVKLNSPTEVWVKALGLVGVGPCLQPTRPKHHCGCDLHSWTRLSNLLVRFIYEKRVYISLSLYLSLSLSLSLYPSFFPWLWHMFIQMYMWCCLIPPGMQCKSANKVDWPMQSE
jgi:hypothetical protein